MTTITTQDVKLPAADLTDEGLRRVTCPHRQRRAL
jgi:hypothetical protein